MSFRESLRDPVKRTRLIALVLALGAVAALPTPSDEASTKLAQFLVPVLWLSFGAFAWSVWFRPDLQWVLWFSSVVLASVALFKGMSPLPLILAIVWALWFSARSKRHPNMKMILLAFTALSFFETRAAEIPRGNIKASTVAGTVEIPAYMRGNRLNEIASCGKADQIPWKFRPDNRKTRLLVKDVLRLNTESKFANWEVHQVMDAQGYVTYIFRKALANGRYESIVAKEYMYNKILETPRGPKVVEVQNLKNLINRPVLVFYHSDGGTLSYLPGLAGRSLVTIQLAQAEGRLLPPVFFKGTVCDRPNDIDQTGDQSTGGTTDLQEPAAYTAPKK